VQRPDYRGKHSDRTAMTIACRKRFTAALLLALLLFSTSTASAQKTNSQDRPPLNYGFISPNTRNDLTIDDAIRNLYSVEESTLIKRIANLACRMHSRPKTARALGSWSDGAEHSVLLRVTANEASIRYLLSRLGQDAKQKSVLYFHVQAGGPDSLYILRPRKLSNLKSIARSLDREGIAFRTLVPTRRGTLIYIVDLGQELRTKVMASAKRLRSRINFKSGNGEFIGDSDDAQKANKVFSQEIKDYESSHAPIAPTCRPW
jgi:hypothetical protein